ncbi:MAG: S49 family peptidase [Dechloromonas sp.]|nr:S49 family peptidase [Dechloromonas sp.]
MSNHHAPQTLHRVSAFDLVASQPWAITPEMLQTISAIARRQNETVEAVEAKLGRPLQNARQASMRGNVAMIPVTGPIFRYANLMTETSGCTSLDVLARDLAVANSDSQVSAIILNIDSPGGQATGIAEFAQMVRESQKPVLAYVGGHAASAAYWIASAAREIVVSKTGMVGSIGCVLSVDTARSQNGLIEIVSSQSPNKRPDVMTEQGRAEIQGMVDALAQVFVDDVAIYRGVDSPTVLSDFGQGGMRLGATAVASGMADRIGSLEQILAELANGKVAPARKGRPIKSAISQAKHVGKRAKAAGFDPLAAEAAYRSAESKGFIHSPTKSKVSGNSHYAPQAVVHRAKPSQSHEQAVEDAYQRAVSKGLVRIMGQDA